MALINCPECKKEISSEAKLCPNCAYNIKKYVKGLEKSSKKIKVENDVQGDKVIHKKKKSFFIGVSGIILLMLGAITSILYYMSNATPEVTGLSVTEAMSILDEHKIEYAAEYSYTENYNKDLVYEQSIKAKSFYHSGDIITLKVSEGRTYIFPDIIDKNIDDVKDEIGDIVCEYAYEYTDDKEKGIVLSTSIDAGSMIKDTEVVNIVLSQGLYTWVPEEIVGMTEVEAKKALEDLGLEVKTKYYYSINEKGTVSKCNPEKFGDKGETIEIYVSKGEGVTVPTVVGKSEKEAIKLLADEGFGAKVVYTYPDMGADCMEKEKEVVSSQSIKGMVDATCDVIITIPKQGILISNVKWDINSVGGVDTYISFKNISDMQIAYITFTMAYYDRMGYKATCTIRDKSRASLRYTGPLKAGSSVNNIYWEAVLYNNTVSVLQPKSATIEFLDGSEQTITFGGRYWYGREYYGGDLHD